MKRAQNGTLRIWNCLLSALTLGFTMQAYAAENETKAVAYCIAQGAVEPAAFAYCVGAELTVAEIKKCITGGDCFGKSNDLRQAIQRAGINFDHIEKYGWCGGPNSEARRIFGNSVCGCAGPERSVRIENRTNQEVRFLFEGSCSERGAHTVAQGHTITLTGVGDDWFNITVKSDGGTVHYGLDAGMTYAFQWTTRRRPPLLDVVNITPRFSSRDQDDF